MAGNYAEIAARGWGHVHFFVRHLAYLQQFRAGHAFHLFVIVLIFAPCHVTLQWLFDSFREARMADFAYYTALLEYLQIRIF